MKIIWIIVFIFVLNGCTVGHEDWIRSQNTRVGKKTSFVKPFTFTYKKPGEFYRGTFAIVGKGITHVTYDSQGNLVTHWDSVEILPTFANKKLVGKCLYYIVIDPETDIIKDWGFDEGGNPLSCRNWP